jgi:hypothetical protein
MHILLIRGSAWLINVWCSCPAMICICCTISKAHGETTQARSENSKTFVEAGATKFDEGQS